MDTPYMDLEFQEFNINFDLFCNEKKVCFLVHKIEKSDSNIKSNEKIDKGKTKI